MKPQLDLRDLALDRPRANPSTSTRPKRRHVVTRYLIPLGIFFGFLGLLGWAAWDRLLPRKPVTVVPVVVTRAEVREEGTPLFQAAGWIEPRPTAIHVPALTEGVVQELLVVEGQSVKAGEAVAKLVQVDAEMALQEAKVALALQSAELQSAEAELKAATLRLKNPVTLDAALADAESQLAKTETELAKIPFLIDAATSRMAFAQKDYHAKREAAGSVPQRSILQAKSEWEAFQAEWKELGQRKPRLEREAEALRKKVQSLKTERELLIEESRAKEDAEAKVLAAQARTDQAKLAVDKADLNLKRTVIQSSVTGRVLRLVAAPGTRVMGLDPAAEHKSSTVVTLYDPKQLQVRADVRLEDVPLVQPGQPVQIETASSKEPLLGVVLLPTSSANIQKNTLEVKVAINEPPPTITPEMLVTATFLAPPQPKSSQDESEAEERLLIPRPLVESTADGTTVWIVDTSGIARKVNVELGRAGIGDLVEVTQGLDPTDKLISGGREALRDGDRITITGEDQSLGVAESRPPQGP